MRRALAGTVLVAAAAAALVGVARVEAARHADRQNDGIEQVRQAVGPLDAPSLAGFRFLDAFQCLIYRAGGSRFGLELCVDWEGRVVEAMDRRDGVRIWSLREDPGRARVRVDRRQFEQVVVGLCADCEAIFARAQLPGGQARR